MGRNTDYKNGERAGIRQAIAWLHSRAKTMNDPNEKAVLNTSAYHIGIDLSRGDPDLVKVTE